MQDMKDKTAVILGGNSGIGAATAVKLADLGASVVIFGRDRDKVEATLARLGSKGDAVVGDISRPDDLDRLMQRVKDRFGRIDLLFVNAGIARVASFEDTSEALYDAMFDINVKGGFFSVQKALPLLAPGSAVVFNSSIANRVGTPSFSVYSATKGAVSALMRALAVELIERGIRVNAVSPGFTETPIFETFGMNGDQIDELIHHRSQLIPAKRFAAPEEIASAVVYLATSPYVVGQEIVVDGGVTMALAN